MDDEVPKLIDAFPPGFAEVAEWPKQPARPVKVIEVAGWRDGTGFVVLADSEGCKYEIFFDRFLGRLCFGGTHHEEDGVAFVRVGSVLETELIAILENAPRDIDQHNCLARHISRAKHWSPNYP